MKIRDILVSFFLSFFLSFFWLPGAHKFFFIFISGDGFKDQAANSGGFSFNLRFLFQNRVISLS